MPHADRHQIDLAKKTRVTEVMTRQRLTGAFGSGAASADFRL
jgi:hypothetical protein